MSKGLKSENFSRPSTPNTYLLAPAGRYGAVEIDQDSPTFAEAPAALYSRIKAMVASSSGWELATSDDANHFLTFIVTSKLFRFKDDIDVEVIPDGSGSKLAIYSRSRVGKSDLGANKKRVQAMLADLA